MSSDTRKVRASWSNDWKSQDARAGLHQATIYGYHCAQMCRLSAIIAPGNTASDRSLRAISAVHADSAPVSGRRTSRLINWLVIAIGLAIWSCAAAASPGEHHETWIAGLVVNRHAAATGVTLLPLPHGAMAVDMTAFATGTETAFARRAGRWWLTTPLGRVSWPLTAAIHHAGHWFMPTDTLAGPIAARIRFDARDFALRVDVPWSTAARHASLESAPQPHRPDITAPQLSLSRWQSDVYETHLAGATNTSSLTWLGGALGSGAWQAGIQTGTGMPIRLDSYSWTIRHGHSRWLLGNDQVALSQLLPYAQITGVEYGWTSQPSSPDITSAAAMPFATMPTQQARTISGSGGPPGGTAVLRINGVPTARTTVRLDGRWVFRNIPVHADEHVDVALYARFDTTTPVQVVPVAVPSAAHIVPAGDVIGYAGLGLDGNPLDSEIGVHGLGGFAQIRAGLTQDMTAGAAIQRTLGQDYGMADLAFGLGAAGTWSVAAARHGAASAWSVSGNGAAGAVTWSGYITRMGAGYVEGLQQIASGLTPGGLTAAGTVQPASSDQYAQVGWALSRGFSMGLAARAATAPWLVQSIRFIRPSLAWQPSGAWSIAVSPDYFGSESWNINGAIDGHDQVTWTQYDGTTQAQWRHDFGTNTNIMLAVTRESLLGTRYSALLSGLWAGPRPVLWTAGPLEAHGRLGYLLDAAFSVVPGLSAHLQIQEDPLLASRLGGNGLMVQAVLAADFAVTTSGLVDAGAVTWQRGSIAGRILGTLPSNMTWHDIRGVTMLVDGHPRGHVDATGHYLIAGLRPGVYRIQINARRLPIDLAPSAAAPWVQVRPGVTTTADFHIDLRLGFAGRVSIQGHPAAGVPVTVATRSGTTVATAVTDIWGYYRVDGLSPGTYRVTAAGASRVVVLDRAFLFQENLPAPR